ncbi:MAG: EamA family transporter [Gammaproteobacteria bacterium]|nr:EamA family transporter [Gammaproteobacteria bacterium]MBT8111701.1 EamA family transporter [Gammaproteobacteria bacterium]NND46845.1 EamA family transporter [Woeseiaceae bacterium]NNL46399.1 EamA family transporter [Woeseiaceae bacterium]
MSNTVLYLITVLIWGSTWLAIEFQLGVVAPEVSIVYRYALASLVLFIYCKINRLKLLFNLKSHVWFALLGAFLFCLNYIFAYRAQVHITSALAAIAFSTMLWINIILSRLIFGTRAGRRVLFGAFLGILGIIVLFAPQVGEVSLSDEIFFGSILALLGALTASIGNMLSQGAQRRALPVMQANAWGMLYGAFLTAIIALFQGQPFTFDATFTYIASLAYLALFGSVVAFGAYLTLLGRIGAHKAGYATVMFPVVALILSILFEGLGLDMSIVLGTALVLLGNLLVLREK